MPLLCSEASHGTPLSQDKIYTYPPPQTPLTLNLSPSLHLPPLPHLYLRTFLRAILSAQLALIHPSQTRLQYSPFPVPWESESPSFLVVSDSLQAHGLYSPWNSPGQNTGVGSLSLLQGIIPTQGSNPGLLHCRRILYQVSHKGSPRILDQVAYPFPSGSSRPRNRTRISCNAGRLFTTELSGKPWGTLHSLPLPTGKLLFVLYICESASFLLCSLVCYRC